MERQNCSTEPPEDKCQYLLTALPLNDTAKKSVKSAEMATSIHRMFKTSTQSKAARCPEGVMATEATYDDTAELPKVWPGRVVTACAIAPLRPRAECAAMNEGTQSRCSVRFGEASDRFSVEEHVKLKIKSCLKTQPKLDPHMYVSSEEEYLKCYLGEE